MTLWADYSAQRLTPAALLAAGFGGAVLYAGTPGRAKNIVPGEVSAALAAGLKQALVYEDLAGDASGGYTAGVAHAQALLADARHCGVPDTVPVAAAADQHLAVAQVAVAVQYQTGFYCTVKSAGWAGPVGAYGFAEFLTAVRGAGVADWHWQCGAWSQVNRGWVHLYQRNGSGGPVQPYAASATVGGIAVDINDQLLPFPASSEDDMADTPLYVQAEQLDASGKKTGAVLKGLYSGGYLSGLGPADIAIWDAKVASGEIKECTWITWPLWLDWDSKGNGQNNLLKQTNDLLTQLLAAVKANPGGTGPGLTDTQVQENVKAALADMHGNTTWSAGA